METQTTIDSRSESWSEETVRAGWYFRETKSSGGSRSYQIVNTHTRGVFDVKKGMSCSPQSIFAKPVFVTADGDTVRD